MDIKNYSFKLPSNIKTLLRRLNHAGFEAYLVGGCARDFLLGRRPSDFDITTSARPDEIRTLFKDFGIADTGVKHGTLTVISDGQPVEITTFRNEYGYSDGRRPDLVVFTTDLISDLSRRDFTINAVCIDADGRLLDCIGGSEDIENKIIRTVGDPSLRFCEDALRILRALRFASVLGFTIESSASHAIHQQKSSLLKISSERISSEFSKIITSDCENILLEYADVFTLLIPELSPSVGLDQKSIYHTYDVYTHMVKAANHARPELIIRLAAFFHDIGKPVCLSEDANGNRHFYSHPEIGADMTARILRRLRYDNKTIERVCNIIKYHDVPLSTDSRVLKRRLSSWGERLFFDVLEIKRADTMALAPEYHSRLGELDRIQSAAEAILTDKTCLSLKELEVNGYDMLSVGYRGKDIGIILNELLSMVLSGEAENNRSQLLEAAAVRFQLRNSKNPEDIIK